MAPTGIVIDQRYLEHDTGAGHPERPARIANLAVALAEHEGADWLSLEPRPATVDEIAFVHEAGHIERVAASAEHTSYAFDADTPVCARSYDIALLAAGGLLELLDAIVSGAAANGFALVRPPGHHAEADRAMGFCLFNNVAVGARYLQHRHDIERIVIVDWDVHHGNGTQHIFAEDPSVLYVSTHQYPFYPGTGSVQEVGRGEGEGITLNIPLPAGCGDDEYFHAFERIIDPVCRQFDPDFVLISAGFDAHRRDPLAAMEMTEQGYARLTRLLLRMAADHAGGRCAAVLEGGYDLGALAASVLGVLDEMGGDRLEEELPHAEASDDLIEQVITVQKRYWEL